MTICEQQNEHKFLESSTDYEGFLYCERCGKIIKTDIFGEEVPDKEHIEMTLSEVKKLVFSERPDLIYKIIKIVEEE